MGVTGWRYFYTWHLCVRPDNISVLEVDALLLCRSEWSSWEDEYSMRTDVWVQQGLWRGTPWCHLKATKESTVEEEEEDGGIGDRREGWGFGWAVSRRWSYRQHMRLLGIQDPKWHRRNTGFSVTLWLLLLKIFSIALLTSCWIGLIQMPTSSSRC